MVEVRSVGGTISLYYDRILGGEEAMSKTDYCTTPSNGSGQTRQQSDSSDSHHYSSPEDKDLPVLTGYGGDPPAGKIPLKECEGDCDEDVDVSYHWGALARRGRVSCCSKNSATIFNYSSATVPSFAFNGKLEWEFRDVTGFH